MGLNDAPASERYRLEGPLGRGGMASVEAAFDTATGRRVALKRLREQADEAKRLRNAELFQREYYTLAQLAHPRIVEVYDYGVDALGPYYTMELLDGGDLQQFAPLPWQTACAIARDVASALSLLHSRRLVHRDVSPRNVRRSADGLAKLIDFGAITPMGPSQVVVGTPPCCAPESVHSHALDGRTDLFALGATLYYVLVGHHAYAARQFSQLSEAWQRGFARPSELVEGIPEALDALVLDLLRLEPDARPANAAELIDRLSAIDGVAPVEQLRVAQAYLVMPSLVGRDAALARARRKLKRAIHTRGRTLLVEGEPGVGRSRFLEACALEAALLGAVCARADADDAHGGDYALLRAIARQLRTVVPLAAELAARGQAELLGQVIPELGTGLAPQAPVASRRELQAALLAWFKALSHAVPLAIAVDDAHRIDEPSAALLSLLAHDAPHHLALLLSAERGASWLSPPAHKLLLETATRFELSALSLDDSEKLLRSLFGDVPNVGALAHRLYEVTAGKPRDLLRLAQHLVDRGAVRYEAGAWSLPARTDAADLPDSLASALAARVAALRPEALRLGLALALCPDQSFGFDECLRLVDPREPRELLHDCDELLAADIARRLDDRMRLAKPIWIAPLRALAAPALERELHALLAALLEARGQAFRAGQHFLHAGEHGRALDVLVAHARVSQDETARDPEEFMRYARSLPEDWLEVFVRALALCDVLGRPARDSFYLRGRLAGLVPAFGGDDRGQFRPFVEQLERITGLSDWAALDASLPPAERVSQALQLAAARFASQSEHDRILPPAAALPILTRAVSAATSRVVVGLDVAYLRALPPVAAFTALSPALAVLERLVAGLEARFTGRTQRAQRIYAEVLERSGTPDHGGLDPSYAEFMRMGVMNALGVMDACLGLDSALHWADQTSAYASYQLNAVQTRLLYQLFQGNSYAADECRRQGEKLRLQTVQLYETSQLVWEIGAYVIAEDLTRLRHAIEQMAPFAQRYPAWKVVQQFASAEFHRIRRDPARALAIASAALQSGKLGEHPLWASLATTYVRALEDLGRRDEALAAADRFVELARDEALGPHAESLWQAQALVRARAGDASAAQLADAVIDRYTALGVRGIALGSAHETRARVALALGDEEGFKRSAEACRAYYCKHKNSALLAKYRRLVQENERKQRAAAGQLSATPDSYGNYTGMRIVGALEFCKGEDERARLALTILCRQSGATGGFLFTFGEHGAECIGAVGGIALPESILPRVQRYLALHTERAPTTSTDTEESLEAEGRDWGDEHGRLYQPVLLRHEAGGSSIVMGLALLALTRSEEFRYPAEIAAAISRFWADRGDTSLIVLAD
ncbi:MAG TPA: serine/threonine-protein kinase [Polyangiales bacterium]|nr:serine/threonine-protein kinase [Polyangiales bacterium]